MTLTRTQKRHQDAVLKDWLTENGFTSVDAFLDNYCVVSATNPEIIDDLKQRMTNEKAAL